MATDPTPSTEVEEVGDNIGCVWLRFLLAPGATGAGLTGLRRELELVLPAAPVGGTGGALRVGVKVWLLLVPVSLGGEEGTWIESTVLALSR